MYYLDKIPILFSKPSGGPPPFAPTDIPNCALWLDAADPTAVQHTSSYVYQWNDKSGNGNHAIQATGTQQPTTGTRTQNGKNVLDFDGGDRLGLPSPLYTVSAGPNTALVVRATDSVSANQRTVGGFTSADATRWGFLLNDSAGNLAVRNNTAGTSLNKSVSFDTNAHIDGLRRNGTNLDNICDGILNSAASAVDYTMNNMWIGASNTVAFPLNGMIAEIIIYQAALSDANLNIVGNYLATKWGITWTNV